MARPDVLKVDTDGFDGKVLGGATQLLRASRPSVLFEWHPGLCRRVGTDDGQAFSVLRAADYTRYIFFTKFGQFSHFGDEHLDKLRKLCLTSETLSDWHFDVAALHAGSPVDDIALSDLGYWGVQAGAGEAPRNLPPSPLYAGSRTVTQLFMGRAAGAHGARHPCRRRRTPMTTTFIMELISGCGVSSPGTRGDRR